MRSSFIYVLAVLMLIGATLGGCKKKSALSIDNNSVIQKPYTLYVADTNGALFHTNDGARFNQVPGPGSGPGLVVRAVTISDTNILFVIHNAFVSDDKGNNFNPISPENIANPNTYWQSMIMDVPAWNRIYMSTIDGIAYSDSNGRMYTWKTEGVNLTSFTVLRNGNLVGINGVTNTIFRLEGLDKKWEAKGSGLPAGGPYHLTHFEDMIVAADYTGANGVLISSDYGVNWTPFTGIPTDGRIFCLTGAFDQSLLVGTEKHGIFRVVPKSSTEFKPSNDGLLSGAEIKGLTTKSNIYKNGAVKQYVFASTNRGVFMSENLGENWTLVFDRNCTAIY